MWLMSSSVLHDLVMNKYTYCLSFKLCFCDYILSLVFTGMCDSVIY